MSSNRFAFAALATACVTAAGVGGYLASRSTATPAAAPVASAPAAPATASPASSSGAATQPAQEPETAAAGGSERADRVGKSDGGAKMLPAESGSTTGASRTASARQAAPRPAASAKSTEAGAPDQEPAAPAQSVGSAQPPGAMPPPAFDPQAPAMPRPDDHASDIARLSEPPTKSYDELVIGSESVLGLQFDRTISSATARIEDRVDARVTRDVRVGEKVAIPSGARAIGSVTEVDRGGKFKERARLGIRFNTLVLADGTRVPISTETIYRDGEPPSSAQKMGGGAVAGAILGAILGGAKGAAIGAGAGAGAGAAATAAGDRTAATFPAGTQTTVRIIAPVTITIER